MHGDPCRLELFGRKEIEKRSLLRVSERIVLENLAVGWVVSECVCVCLFVCVSIKEENENSKSRTRLFHAAGQPATLARRKHQPVSQHASAQKKPPASCQPKTTSIFLDWETSAAAAFTWPILFRRAQLLKLLNPTHLLTQEPPGMTTTLETILHSSFSSGFHSLTNADR